MFNEWASRIIPLLGGIYLIIGLTCSYYYNHIFEMFLHDDKKTDAFLARMGASNIEVEIFKDTYSMFNGGQKFIIVLALGLMWPYTFFKKPNSY